MPDIHVFEELEGGVAQSRRAGACRVLDLDENQIPLVVHRQLVELAAGLAGLAPLRLTQTRDVEDDLACRADLDSPPARRPRPGLACSGN